MRVTVESVFREQAAFTEAAKTQDGLLETQVRLLAIIVSGLALYGIGMGAWQSSLQALSAAVKLPLLFLFTMAITLPAFHFVGLLAGSRTYLGQTLVVFLHGLAITSILSMAFLPVVLFFLLTNPSYSFMLLLHVSILAFSSIAGLSAIHRNIRQLTCEESPEFARFGSSLCIRGWMLLFAFVGTQLAYTLSPFLGRDDGFSLINPGEGNFYSALCEAISGLF